MKKDGFVYDFHNKDFIFMRWKEHFLVPDHRVRTINGASFAGFYYICYQLSTGIITGFYFHKTSERYVFFNFERIWKLINELKWGEITRFEWEFQGYSGFMS